MWINDLPMNILVRRKNLSRVSGCLHQRGPLCICSPRDIFLSMFIPTGSSPASRRVCHRNIFPLLKNFPLVSDLFPLAYNPRHFFVVKPRTFFPWNPLLFDHHCYHLCKKRCSCSLCPLFPVISMCSSRPNSEHEALLFENCTRLKELVILAS